MKPLMLCVCMDPGRVMRISMIAAALGIAVREAKEDQAGQRLDALCGLAASKTAAYFGEFTRLLSYITVSELTLARLATARPNICRLPISRDTYIICLPWFIAASTAI